MTDNTRQQKILAAIDSLLAGEPRTPDEDQDLERLLLLAGELNSGRPEPTDSFRRQLDERLRRLQTDADVLPAEPVMKPRVRRPWLPGWLTLPRAGAVMAALVIGLGAIGLTGALIRGKGTLDTTRTPENGLISDTGRTVPGTDALSDQKAAGLPGTDDYLSGETGTAGVGDNTSSPAAADTGGGEAVIPGLPLTQRVIQNADYEIEVATGDFQDRYSQVTALAARYGGYVVTANTRKTGEDRPLTGSITIRVANTGDNFTRARTELDGMGMVIRKDISGQDVIQDYVDLQSRLRNAEAQEAQLLSLMQKAQSIDDILTVQSRLADIQLQIEQLKGRLQYIEGRTDFASISVELREATDGIPDTGGSDTNWGFVDALEYAGWLAVQTINFVIMALGIIIPVGLISALLFTLGYRLWRRRG
ncbi:MAG: DUF4349 domain-containing protein [Thermoleophilia bacterium]